MRTLLTRSISGLIFVALVVLSLLLKPDFFLGFCALIVGISMSEFHKLFLARTTRVAEFISILLGLSCYFIISVPISLKSGYNNNSIFLLFIVITLYAIVQLLLYKRGVKKLLIMLSSLLYIVLPFVLAFQIHFNDIGEFPMVLGIFILVWTNDTFAYLSGNLIGKHKLYEKVSPNKTWEGFAGGVLASALMGYFLNSYVYTGNEFANGFWLKAALILAPAAVIGDLFESWLKRKMHVKDTGNIMPGHGGVLDRFDAMFFAIPAFYILLYLCDI